MRFFRLFFFGLLSSFTTLAAQNSKLSGRIIDAVTKEPLIGANVMLVGTSQGTVTNVTGDYTLLNVRPGTYSVRASYVGYQSVTKTDVEIKIGRSVTLDFKLEETAQETADVEVIAERPVVELDVGASQATYTAQEIKALPVASISGALSLTAGVDGFGVRGSGSDELLLNIDGIASRDPRTNSQPLTVGILAVNEVQIKTSGFTAESGSVRSGQVEIITKEGDASRYEVELATRYSPAAPKHFGAYANDPNSYWIRPYTDDAVAFTGTQAGGWSLATQQQYPQFVGWNAISRTLLNDTNPNNDLTPEALRAAFLYQHRKDLSIRRPDQQIEVAVGGPSPLINKLLKFGQSRFFAYYTSNDEALVIPLHTSNYKDQLGRLQITSNIGKGAKLQLAGQYSVINATSASNTGSTGFFRSATGVGGAMTGVSFIDTRIFSTDYWAPTRVQNMALSFRFTQTFGTNAYLDVRGSRIASKYSTNPGRPRDNTGVVTIGGVSFDEGPFGFEDQPLTGVDGMRMGVGMSTSRDSSNVAEYNIKGDFTAQLSKTLEFKTGAEYNNQDIDMNYGNYDAFLTASNTQYKYEQAPIRAAGYALLKYESKGMFANMGLRAEFSDAKTDWYAFNPDNYYNTGWNSFSTSRETIDQEAAKKIFTLSPRISFTFPISLSGKFLFNYGHFRSLPTPDNLFRLGYAPETGVINTVSNPSLPFPKTISYELGYEHVINNGWLLKSAGFYKDISDEPYSITMIGNSRTNVRYTYVMPFAFADIRGAEFTLEKRSGNLKGLVNYAYQIVRSGNFGFPTYNQSSSAQQTAEETFINNRTRAGTTAQPSNVVKFNARYLTPKSLGRLFSNWLLSTTGNWTKGIRRTWAGGGAAPPEARLNLKSVDFFNLNARLSKDIKIGKQALALYVDVNNVLNTKRLSATGFFNGTDTNDYLRSLHLPASEFYMVLLEIQM
jgi:CarboxypepD_reg-like domain/Outer membrane protein beta-barrel family